MLMHGSNILLCLRYGIGDVIMELPILDRLREVLPQARITALGAEPAVEILEADTRVDDVVSIQQWGLGHIDAPADSTTQQKLIDWLNQAHFDLVLDPSHAANAVRKVIRRYGIPIMDCVPAYLDAGLAMGMDGLSAVRHGARLGWGLEVPASCYPTIRVQPREIEWARTYLEEASLTGDLVAVSLSASSPLKRWPTAHFAQVCRYLMEQRHTSVLAFGGPGEAGLLHELRDRIGRRGRLEIVQSLHL
ncbi:MAG: glycosyltransferase family 9 protein, partial [Solirubrobacterales bacterium]